MIGCWFYYGSMLINTEDENKSVKGTQHEEYYLNSEKMLRERLESDEVGRYDHSWRVVCSIMIRRNLTYKIETIKVTLVYMHEMFLLKLRH